MTDSIRAYVNGRGVDVPQGASAIDAVRVADSDAADQVVAGERALTDSRGLPLEPSTVLVAGSIVRIVSGRRRGAAAE
jgi:tagatose-1,6-bisphosphate aldolase non-catalytic subunit AgaZ/GatZ